MLTRNEFEKKWRSLIGDDKKQQELVNKNFDSLYGIFEANTDDLLRSGKIIPVRRDIDVLITSIGVHDPTLVAYLYKYLRPKKIIVLRTEKAKDCMDKLLKMSLIDLRVLEVLAIESMEAIHIYEKLKSAMKQAIPERVTIDVTAGTSLMSVALAKIAMILNADVTWVQTDPEDRKLLPWTSRLEPVADPLNVWGDYEIRHIKGLFANHQYATCVQYLSDLLKRVPLYTEVYFQMETRKKFSELFLVWNQLDLSKAHQRCSELIHILERVTYTHPFDIQFLKKKLEILDILKDVQQGKSLENLKQHEVVRYLLAYLYHTAERRASNEDYMSAVLYLYRTLEMIAQFRLMLKSISPDEPDYSILDKVSPGWQQRYEKIGNDNKLGNELPKEISMFNGFRILQAIEDPVMDGQKLMKIQGKARPRNKMILEHGFDIVDDTKYHDFKCLVIELLERNFTIENWNLKTSLEQIAFPDELP